MLLDAFVRFLNHLLTGERWAQERLKPFAGQQVSLLCGPARFGLMVEGDGSLRPAPANDAAAVQIVLPADAPLRFVTDRASLLSVTRISGNADLAEALAFLFRHLRWDAEADLADAVGDIAARRLAQGARQALAWQRDAAGRLAANFAEYFSEESRVLLPGRDLAAFAASVASLDANLKRLESRLAKIG
ncbi:MAG: SCP2 domain-containing protein [Betaproteobacteria bacterium]